MLSAKSGNYEAAASQLLRALRGKRSQRAFARRLGYAANPITDWEHRRRFPTAEEMLRAATIVGVDVESAFRRFHPAPLAARGKGVILLAPWLDAVRGSTPVLDLARRAGLSRFAVGRHLRGDARPRVPDFFRLVDAATRRLPDLVAALVPIERVPALQGRFLAAEAARRAAYEAPWTEAVLRVLETPAYRTLAKHDDEWVARHLRIPVGSLKASLDLLKRSGAVRRDRGILRVTDESSVDTRGETERVNALLRHWSDTAKQRIDTRREDDLFAYNVCSLSAADYERARKVLRDAFREVRSLVAASEPAERVALLNVQLLRLDFEE